MFMTSKAIHRLGALAAKEHESGDKDSIDSGTGAQGRQYSNEGTKEIGKAIGVGHRGRKRRLRASEVDNTEKAFKKAKRQEPGRRPTKFIKFLRRAGRNATTSVMDPLDTAVIAETLDASDVVGLTHISGPGTNVLTRPPDLFLTFDADWYPVQHSPALSIPEGMIEDWIKRSKKETAAARVWSSQQTTRGDWKDPVPTRELTDKEFDALFVPPVFATPAPTNKGKGKRAEKSRIPLLCTYAACRSTKMVKKQAHLLRNHHHVCKACWNYHNDHDGGMRSPEMCAREKFNEELKGKETWRCDNPYCGIDYPITQRRKILNLQTHKVKGVPLSDDIDLKRLCYGCDTHMRRESEWRSWERCHK